jgi:D-sedoheptulose 7-phosphate isomerase
VNLERHLEQHLHSLLQLERKAQVLDQWGQEVARRLLAGGRLLAAGNGGSAAQAQHLTAELVGRFESERMPLSAIALHAETSSLTAIANDYGYGEAMARQVRAHGRAGDVLVALSTSGRSPNLLAAVASGRQAGLLTLALTGPAPNPLAAAAQRALSVGGSAAVVQEIHLVAVHLLCGAVDLAVAGRPEIELVR